MRPFSLLAAFVLGLMLWSPSHPAAAETYSYVDEQGKMHFTDAYHSIPKRYRNRVQAQGGAEPGDVAGILGLPGQTAKVGAMKRKFWLSASIRPQLGSGGWEPTPR